MGGLQQADWSRPDRTCEQHRPAGPKDDSLPHGLVAVQARQQIHSQIRKKNRTEAHDAQVGKQLSLFGTKYDDQQHHQDEIYGQYKKHLEVDNHDPQKKNDRKNTQNLAYQKIKL